VDIKKVFLWVGAVTAALVVSLALGAVYVIEMNIRDLNRRRTEKARQTKLDNLANQVRADENGVRVKIIDPSDPDYTDDFDELSHIDHEGEDQKNEEKERPG